MPSSKSTLNLFSTESRKVVVGVGEVGKAIYSKLEKASHNVWITDIMESDIQHPCDVLHICFPYSSSFVNEVKRYQRIFTPKFTIIHSTVPVGTSRKCAAIHAPIRGLHPYLEESLGVFPMFLGGKEASLVADYFRKSGVKVILVADQETTEAGKLFDTEYYRKCIEFMLEVKKFCDKNNLNFHEVYTLFNQTYNEAYIKLGYPEYARPVLQPIETEIGGHCVVPNSKLLYDKK